MKHYDAIIIGFGKGGKTLAGELAKRGKKVALIEKSNQMYGGTCINEGCIPSKSLIVQADTKEYLAAVEQKENLITKLRQKNYDKLAQLDNVDIIDGTARFVDNYTVEIDGQKTIFADYIFINTGSKSDSINSRNSRSQTYIYKCYNHERNNTPKELSNYWWWIYWFRTC